MTSRYLPFLLVVVVIFAAFSPHETNAGLVRGTRTRSQRNTGKLDLREMTIMEMVRQVTKDHPDVARHIIREVTDRVGGAEGDMFYRQLMDELDTPTDGSGCNTCLTFANVLNTWSRLVSYPDIEDTVIEFCELLLTALDERNNGKVICPGTVKTQGPHVFSVIRRTTSEEACEALNACYVQSPVDPNWPPSPGSLNQDEIDKLFADTVGMRAESYRSKRSADSKKVPGVVTIAQITDVHVELDYQEGSSNDCGLYVCCQAENTENTNAGYWGDYNCNVPQRTVQLFLDKIEQDLLPDYVIFSGDVPPHTMWEETFSSQYAATERLVEMMTSTFTNTRVLPTIGNHEMYPTNLFSTKNMRTETVPLLIKFADLWKDIAQFDSSSVESFQQYGHYTALLQPRLRILSIMTNYMYSANFYNAINRKPQTEDNLNDGEAIAVKQMIVDILTSARAANEKVILLGHHVVGGGDYIISEAKWFESLTANFSDIIILQLAGHTHTDEFRLMFNDDGTTIQSMMYVSPSVDLHGTRNPSVRVYELNDTTWEVLDYTQYYFDLSAYSGATPEPVITKLYSAREEYGLSNLNPQSWYALLFRFMNDESLILKHINNERARAGEPTATCDSQCRLKHVCRQRYASYDRYLLCIRNFDPVTTPAPTPEPTTRPTLPILTPPPDKRA